MQRYFAKEKQDQEFLLSNDDLYHIKTVMRMEDGEKIEVVYQEKVYQCCLENVNQQWHITEEKELVNNSEMNQEIILILPLLKEAKMDFILQKATELGVSKIIPITMKRSIIKLETSREEKRIERWTRICKEASEQSKRVRIPVLTRVKKWEEITSLDGLRLVCSTTETTKNLKFFLQSNPKCGRIVLVIGPEGGLEEQEETFLVSHGFERVTLGNRILRAETAPLFVLSAINYEYME